MIQNTKNKSLYQKKKIFEGKNIEKNNRLQKSIINHILDHWAYKQKKLKIKLVDKGYINFLTRK